MIYRVTEIKMHKYAELIKWIGKALSLLMMGYANRASQITYGVLKTCWWP